MHKKNKSYILLIVLPILFIILNFFVYLGHYQSPLDGNEAFPEWFIFASHAPEPLNIKKITLAKTVNPDYFHPFQKFEYHYSEKDSSETVISEEHSMFSTDMTNITGDPATFYDENVDGMFYRGLGDINYPNGLFFLIQYLIISAFIFLSYKQLKKIKN